jgi:hypothetical protein
MNNVRSLIASVCCLANLAGALWVMMGGPVWIRQWAERHFSLSQDKCQTGEERHE